MISRWTMVLGVLVLVLTFVLGVRGMIVGEPCSRSAPQVTSVEQEQSRLPDGDEPCRSDGSVRAIRVAEWVFGLGVAGLVVSAGMGVWRQQASKRGGG